MKCVNPLVRVCPWLAFSFSRVAVVYGSWRESASHSAADPQTSTFSCADRRNSLRSLAPYAFHDQGVAADATAVSVKDPA